MFERFTEKSIKTIMLAQEEARRLGHNFVGTEQILLGLIGEGSGYAAKALKSFGVTLRDTRVEVEKIIGRGSGFVAVEIPFTPRSKKLLECSWGEAKQLGHNYIGTEHLLLALLLGDGVAVRVLKHLAVDLAKVRSQLMKLMTNGATEAITTTQDTPINYAGLSWLDQFGTDISAMAKSGKLDPVEGREPEIDRVMSILCQRSNANALIIGESGVGKSAVVRGLAARIAAFDAHESLLDAKIVSLDIQHIIAHKDACRIIKESLEVAKECKIIPVIDELDVLMAPQFKGSVVMDAVNLLNWFLKHNKINCIAIADLSNIRPHYEAQAALLQNFQAIVVRPCSPDAAIKILLSLRPKLENHHELSISEEAILQAVALSEEKIKNRLLPEKAVLVLDEACALVKLRIDKQAGLKRAIAEVRSDIEKCLAENDSSKAESLRGLEAELSEMLQKSPASPGLKAVVSTADIEEAVNSLLN